MNHLSRSIDLSGALLYSLERATRNGLKEWFPDVRSPVHFPLSTVRESVEPTFDRHQGSEPLAQSLSPLEWAMHSFQVARPEDRQPSFFRPCQIVYCGLKWSRPSCPGLPGPAFVVPPTSGPAARKTGTPRHSDDRSRRLVRAARRVLGRGTRSPSGGRYRALSLRRFAVVGSGSPPW